MKKYFGIPLMGFMALFLASLARAEVHPRMTSYFTQKIKQVSSVMAKETVRPASGGAWVLEDINFDLAPAVSFGVSKVLNITVAPEIDFVLTLEE